MPRATASATKAAPKIVKAPKAKAPKVEKPQTRFHERLVLARFLLQEFGLADWDKVRAMMREAENEIDANGVPDYLPIIRAFERKRLGEGTLEAYDAAIRRDWKRITDGRRAGGRRPRLLYFQYLALLGSHRYLERLFRDRAALQDALNEDIAAWNAKNGAGDQLAAYGDTDLNKLAFWSATGSGKTLLMHAQVLQYLDLSAQARAQGWKNAPAPLDRIFLVTPGIGLSRQHHAEAALSGLHARSFVAGASLFNAQVETTIDTIEITRLGETAGDVVVALDSLQGHNLVLVDEGHRGASGEVWKSRRDTLAQGGLALEYSATFGQAVGGDNSALAQEYARNIALDYSYGRFYHDGYGKEFQIYNLSETTAETQRDRYLAACVLSFYRQRLAFEKWGEKAARWGFEKPLWVFVGGSVSASTKDDVADVVNIALFFQRFAAQPQEFGAHLQELLERRGGLLDKGRDPFAHAFDGLGTDGAATYDAVLQSVFNATGPAALVLDNLKGADGEVALRLGDGAPFGLINVGDTAKFLTAAREAGLTVVDKAVSSSLFSGIAESTSPLSVLIGAKKFSEGWNSFRVSTLGLMKVGQGEGSQIIQLFGRGVRLRGFDGGLRRTSSLEGSGVEVELPPGMKLKDIAPLETLGVFGLKANYMAEFQEALRRENAPAGDEITIPVPTREMDGLDSLPSLHTLRAVVERSFAECRDALWLGEWNFSGKPLKVPVVKLDLHARLESLHSDGVDGAEAATAELVKFGDEQLRWIDWDAVMAVLRGAKSASDWHLLRLDRAKIEGLFSSTNSAWYELKAPAHLMQLSATRPRASIALWQSTIETLLTRLAKNAYSKARSDYERSSLRLESLNVRNEPSYESEWLFTLAAQDADLEKKIRELWSDLDVAGVVNFGDLSALDAKHHFYRPLVMLKGKDKVSVKPVALDKDEYDFAQRLESFLSSGDEWLKHRRVFLLRNKAREGHGIGFYDDGGGFYPDFALWIWEEMPDSSPREYLAFVDPKGLVYFGPDDAKVTLHKRIKDDQERLGNAVTLNSFLVSTTDFEKIGWDGIASEADLEKLGVYLKQTPIKTILEAALQ